MTFSQSISSCMGKYATFSGRASRSEYWWFYLFTLLFTWGASLAGITVDPEWGPDLLGGIVNLVVFMPVIAAGTRRLHDIGRSGWWQLLLLTIIGIVPLIVWMAQEGSLAENQYGPSLLNDRNLSNQNSN